MGISRYECWINKDQQGKIAKIKGNWFVRRAWLGAIILLVGCGLPILD